MKTLLSVIIAFCFFQQIFAQHSSNKRDLFEDNLNTIHYVDKIRSSNLDDLYEGVVGTPYLFDQWENGNIFLVGGDTVSDIPIKYDLYSEQLLYRKSASLDSFIVNKVVIKKFEIRDPKTGVELTFVKTGENNDEFMELLYNGSSKLFLDHQKPFIKADYKGPYSKGIKYDEYKNATQYYLLKKNSEFLKIRLNKSSILKSLSDKKKKIEEFIKKNDLDLNRELDVIRVLTYYDSLN